MLRNSDSMSICVPDTSHEHSPSEMMMKMKMKRNIIPSSPRWCQQQQKKNKGDEEEDK